MRSTILFAALLLCAVSESADARQSCSDYENGRFDPPKDYNDYIVPCTAVILSGNASPAELTKAYVNRGAAYRSNRDYQRALSDFNQAIRLNPDRQTLLGLRAGIYRATKDYKHALADYDDAIRLDLNSLDLEGRRPDPRPAALSLFTKILETDQAGRASVYLLQGDPDRAITELDEIIGKNPKQLVAHTFRGIAYADKRDYDRAIADLNAALTIKPKYTEALYARGLVKRKTGDSAGSSADLADAQRIDPRVANGDWAFLWEHFEN